jgi:hypothetical protein
MGGVKCGIIRRTKPSEGRMRDLKTEGFLNDGGYTFEYVEAVPLKNINFKNRTSDDNPGRLEQRVDEERADSYARKMEIGVKFPAVVLLKSTVAHGPFEPATGMHRLLGIDRTNNKVRKVTAAYVVTEINEYRRETLIRKLNTIEGVAPTRDEVYNHVVAMCLKFGTTATAEAAAWGVNKQTVQHRLDVIEVKRRAIDIARVRLDHPFSYEVFEKVGQLNMDPVFTAAVKFLDKYKPNTGTALDMLNEVLTQTSEKNQLKVIAETQRDEVKIISKSNVLHGGTSPREARNLLSFLKQGIRKINSVPALNLSAAPPKNRDAIDVAADAFIEGLKAVKAENARIRFQEEAAAE